MSNSGNSIKFDAIREIAAASLTTSFQNLGSAFTRDAFRVTLKNFTNGDIYLSANGGTITGKKMAASSAEVLDNKTNDMFFKAGTQWQVRWDSAPGAPTGSVVLEVEYV